MTQGERAVPTAAGPRVLVLAVKLTTGEVQRHSYPVPASPGEVEDLIARTTARINYAFNPQTPRGFVLENPLALYNLDHVMVISIEGLTDEQLHRIARAAEQRLGFRPS